MSQPRGKKALGFLLTNAGALAIGGVVAQAAYVMLEAIIARRIGSAGYGIYSSSYAFIMIVVHLMDMGMYWRLIQDGSRDPSTIRQKLGTMMFARVAFFFIAYPVLLALTWWFRKDVEVVQFLAVFALFGLQLGIHDLLAAVNVARQQMVINAIFQSIVPVSVLVLTWFMVSGNPSLGTLSISFVVGSSVVTAVWGFLVWRQERPVLNLKEIGPILRSCFQYGITGLVWNVYLRLGILMLTFTSSIEEVAFFAAAFKLVDLVFKFAVLTNRVVAPRMFSDSEHQRDDFVRNTDVMMRLAGAAGAVGAVVLYLASDLIIRLVYGEAFAASSALLRILGVAMALKTIVLLAQTVVAAADDHSARTRIVIVTTALAALIALPCAWIWGGSGMAYAVVLSDLLMLVMLMHRIRKVNPAVRIWTVFSVPLGSAVVSMAATSMVTWALPLKLLLGLLVFAIFFAVSGYLKPVLAVVRQR